MRGKVGLNIWQFLKDGEKAIPADVETPGHASNFPIGPLLPHHHPTGTLLLLFVYVFNWYYPINFNFFGLNGTCTSSVFPVSLSLWLSRRMTALRLCLFFCSFGTWESAILVFDEMPWWGYGCWL